MQKNPSYNQTSSHGSSYSYQKPAFGHGTSSGQSSYGGESSRSNYGYSVQIQFHAMHTDRKQRPSAPVDNRSYVLASHERLPVHVDLPTAEMGVGSTKAIKGRTGGAVED